MIRSRASWCALVGLVATSSLLSACSTEAPSASSGVKSSTITKIGFTVSDLSNPFFSAMEQEVNAQAQKIGATVNAQDGRQNLAAQNTQISTFIQQGVQVIFLDAVDSKGIGPAVESAKKAGIIVIALGDNASGVDAFVGVDNTQAGATACKELATKMGGSGDIAIIDGTAISAVQDRVTGCNIALKAFPDVHVVASPHGDNSIGKGQTVAADVYTAQSNLKGLFGINDPTALGAILAANQAKLSGLTVVSVDGSPAAVTEIKKSASLLYGTASQDPRAMAATGMKVAQKLLKGDKLETTQVLLPSKFIKAGNVGTYQGWQ
ncbi:MAG: substrate-binding domain-containing protein [Thermomicrobiales bacterium]